MGDHRDDTTWVAVELSHQGEVKVSEGTLEKSLRRDLGVDEDFPLFIPCAIYKREGKIVILHLMEGYVFLASGLPETAYFSLERQQYVNQVMSTRSGPHKMRVLSVIKNSDVQEMKLKLQEMISSEIGVGAHVVVTDGIYKNLTGRVTGIDADNAFVYISLRSLEVVATVPRVFLEEEQEG